MENKKYVLTEETVIVDGVVLHRIKSISNFGSVKVGDLGGFVESENNLYVCGSAWVCDSAMVYGEAQVCDSAWVCDSAMVYGSAVVYGGAMVYGSARVCDSAVVYGSARVCGSAMVYGEAQVCGSARVCDSAVVYGEAMVCGSARVCGSAWVYGSARVCGSAWVCDSADYIVFKNWWSSGRFFTWTKSNNMWRVGCFYGSGEELIKKAYQDSELSGREYERVVQYVNSILADEKK